MVELERKGISIDLRPAIPALPQMEEKTKLDVRYVLIDPYEYAHIYWDNRDGELLYEIEEPVLNQEEKNILDKLELSMREVIMNPLTIKKIFTPSGPARSNISTQNSLPRQP